MRLAFSRRMTHINSFKDLTVWQVSMDLADVCFDIVEAIPHPYRFTFANQLIPAGISIPSNIAEGSRRPTKAYLNHLSLLAGLTRRSRDAVRADPTTKAGTGSASEQGDCPRRSHRQDAARIGGIVGGAHQRAERVNARDEPNPKSRIPNHRAIPNPQSQIPNPCVARTRLWPRSWRPPAPSATPFSTSRCQDACASVAGNLFGPSHHRSVTDAEIHCLEPAGIVEVVLGSSRQ